MEEGGVVLGVLGGGAERRHGGRVVQVSGDCGHARAGCGMVHPGESLLEFLIAVAAGEKRREDKKRRIEQNR